MKLFEFLGPELSGAEATFYNYWSKSAEDFVALLLYKDFDKFAALNNNKTEEPGGKAVFTSPLLDSRTKKVGISFSWHSQLSNSTQIIYIYEEPDSEEGAAEALESISESESESDGAEAPASSAQKPTKKKKKNGGKKAAKSPKKKLKVTKGTTKKAKRTSNQT